MASGRCAAPERCGPAPQLAPLNLLKLLLPLPFDLLLCHPAAFRNTQLARTSGFIPLLIPLDRVGTYAVLEMR